MLSRGVSLLGLLVASWTLAAAPVQGTEVSQQGKFFDEQVQPILARHCFKCHGAEAKIKGGLKLTNQEAVFAGGDSGPAVDLDDLDASPLLEAINYEGLEMPPSGKLKDEELAILTKWVKSGAPWSATTVEFGFEGEAEHGHGPPQVNDETKQFWSYQRVQRPAAPDVQRADWVSNPIDAFILHQLEQRGLSPSSPAGKAALVRRAYYDLTGLPPTLAQVRKFVVDNSDGAFERVIDELLESPHYGERWGRHWLDLVRYAESNSFERDGAKPHIWRYRDYVIDSFNEDKPYDQFIREQLAGDELDEMTPASYIATGYFRIGQWDDEPTDQLQADFDGLDDTMATTTQVFMGMTLNCARCHDHKIDPIPQSDYYRMLSFFRGVKPYGHRRLDESNLVSFDKHTGQVIDNALAKGISDEKRKLEKTLREIEQKVKPKLTEPEKEDFQFEDNRVTMLKSKVPELVTQQQVDEYDAALKQLRNVRSADEELTARSITAFGVSEAGREVPATHIMIRGSAHALGDEVEPGFPSVLDFPDPDEIAPRGSTSGRRLALANWISSPENPLTARVLVNRLWQHHFGRGIVETPNDFGFQGAAPTHPRLLDWLASELIAGGWKLKRMHKLIMTSSAYRMSSTPNEASLTADVDNKLFWRMNMRRLSAEEIRDSILKTNGTLNLKRGGPSIYPEISAAVLQGQSRPGSGWGTSSPEEACRRSVYIHVKRSLITPILASFDFADTDFSCPVRFVTTQPTQALGMMNGDMLNREAGIFAQRLRDEAGDVLPDQVALALRLALQREPTAQEIQRGVRFVEAVQKEDGASRDTALDQFCLLILNLNEFIYLD